MACCQNRSVAQVFAWLPCFSSSLTTLRRVEASNKADSSSVLALASLNTSGRFSQAELWQNCKTRYAVKRHLACGLWRLAGDESSQDIAERLAYLVRYQNIYNLRCFGGSNIELGSVIHFALLGRMRCGRRHACLVAPHDVRIVSRVVLLRRAAACCYTWEIKRRQCFGLHLAFYSC